MIETMKRLFGTDGMRGEAAGVITTPGVAYLARRLPADAGVVVSASHNPYRDNCIKIFAPDGRKLDDATERQIESDIYAARAGEPEAGGAKADESAAAGNARGVEEFGQGSEVLRSL